MTTYYTPILKLALPQTGELSGTWGTVVNDNITSMVEQAVAGLATINTWTTNVHNLSTADGTTSESRCAMLVAADGSGGTALTGAGEITCPAASKLYVLKNGSSYAITLKTSGGTGVAVASGNTAFLFCDGTNVNACVTTIVDGRVTGNLTVDGNATINGNTTLGNAATDTITATAQFNTDLLPSTDNARDLGSTAKSWRTLYCETSVIAANLTLSGNTISSTDTNGNIVLAPNGTGDVQLDADTVRVGDSGANATITSNGAGDLILNTNGGTNSGSITIEDGANGNITVATNGTGDVYLDADTVRVGDSNANATITTNGTGDLILNTNSGTNSGAITIEDGANGNIIVAPNGTGDVYLDADTIRVGDSGANVTITSNGAGDLILNTNSGTNSGSITIADGANGNITIATNGTGITTMTTAVEMSATTQNIALGTSQTSGTFTVGGAAQTGTQTFDQSTKAHTLNIGTGATENATTKTINIGTGGVSGSTTTITIGAATGTTTTVNGTLNATTLDLTNLEVTNIKAKDGTAAIVLTDSTGAVTISTALTANGGAVFNENGANVDFRVEGDTDANLLFVDASADFVGVGTNAPGAKLHASSTGAGTIDVAWLNNAQAVGANVGSRLVFTGTTSNNGLAAIGGSFAGATTADGGYMTLQTRAVTSGTLTEQARLTADGLEIKQSQLIGYSSYASIGTNGLAVAGNVGIGTSSLSSKLDVFGANRTNTDEFGTITAYSSDAYAIDKGGSIAFWGKYNAAGGSAAFGRIYGAKQDATDGSFLGYLGFSTSPGGAPVERMRLDSSGNLGLGVTPSAWRTDFNARALQLNNASFATFNDDSLYVAQNGFLSSTGWKYTSTRAATLYTQNAGIHAWSYAPSGFGYGTAATSLTSAQNGNSYTIVSAGNTDFTLIGAANNNVGTTFTKSGGTGAGTGTVSQNISFTQAMTLDASGNLGVGETSMGTIRLYVRKDNATAYSSSNMGVQTHTFLNNVTSGGYSNLILGCASATTGSAVYAGIAVVSEQASDTNGALAFGTRPSGGGNITERARITSGGVFLFGTDNATTTAGAGVKIGINSANVSAVVVDSTGTQDTYNYYSTNAGAFRFYVNSAGTVYATNTTISAISDQRFKENIRDLDVGIDAIMALKPRKFDWKAGKGKDKKDDRGFIAQEFEQVFPDLIDEWKDPAPEGEEPYKSVRQDLIPVLVKAIQEQQAMIKTLEAKIAALEQGA